MDRAGEARAYIEARIAVEDRGYTSPCWIWQCGLTEKGYGRTKVPTFPRQMRVHRAAYVEPVTALENWRRAAESGRGGGGSGHSNGGGGARQKKTHCNCGVELTPEVTAKGKGRCKACWCIYMREWNRTHPRPPRPRAPRSPEAREAYNAKRREMRAAGLWSK